MTRIKTPDGSVFALVYDSDVNLTQVKHNGKAITAAYVAGLSGEVKKTVAEMTVAFYWTFTDEVWDALTSDIPNFTTETRQQAQRNFKQLQSKSLIRETPQQAIAIPPTPTIGPAFNNAVALCAANPLLCGGAAAGAAGFAVGTWVYPTIENPLRKAIDWCTLKTSPWDDLQKGIDNTNYHSTCDRKPPSNLTPCELAKWDRRQAQSCYNKRLAWEERWGNARSKDPHARALANVKRRIANAVEDIIKFCPAQ